MKCNTILKMIFHHMWFVIKFVLNLKHCQIETKDGVVVNIDPQIMVVVCGKNLC